MKTVIVELKNSKALQILKDLEEADLIKLIKKNDTKKSLSNSLRGSLAPEKAGDLQKQIDTMRKEWERDI